MFNKLELFGLLLLLSRTYGEQDVSHRCPGPPDKGPCNRNLYKWAYDKEKHACFMFSWGGCAGNDKNRFDTEIQCIKQCVVQNGKFGFYKLWCV